MRSRFLTSIVLAVVMAAAPLSAQVPNDVECWSSYATRIHEVNSMASACEASQSYFEQFFGWMYAGWNSCEMERQQRIYQLDQDNQRCLETYQQWLIMKGSMTGGE